MTSTTTTLATTATILLSGQSVTLTATVAPVGVGTPTGTVSFLNGAATIGSPITLGAGGIAVLTTTSLPDGNNVVTAVYSGDKNFTGSTSGPVGELVEDFNFTISTVGGSSSQTTPPGQNAVFNFNIAPVNSAFNFPVVLSATGLPPGATATFTPPIITLGSTPTTFTMTIQTAHALLKQPQRGFEFGKFSGGALTLALLILPFGRRLRSKGRGLRPLMLTLFVLLSAGATLGLSGCGPSIGFFGQQQQTYTINVIGTATGSTGTTLQHFATVTLTVE